MGRRILEPLRTPAELAAQKLSPKDEEEIIELCERGEIAFYWTKDGGRLISNSQFAKYLERIEVKPKRKNARSAA